MQYACIWLTVLASYLKEKEILYVQFASHLEIPYTDQDAITSYITASFQNIITLFIMICLVGWQLIGNLR